MKVIVFSTKRSTHHAFLESVLVDRDFYYENNMTAAKEADFSTGKILQPTVKEGEPQYTSLFYVASFEMGYRLPDLLEKTIF